MIKNFGQWEVVKDGIETIEGCGYLFISKQDVMSKNVAYANELMKDSMVNNQSLMTAFKYAYRYFHAMAKFTSKSHPEIYKAMIGEFNKLEWHESGKGFTTETSEGFNITVFRDNKEKWKWVFDEIFSSCSYKSLETAKKKAYSSYYWFYKHIKSKK